ncbi:hypothetical protein LTR56_019503 [Elasticomyces elasticus]|nr:hypothetical protein LTR56_019503 [Elasticomyces elasticus]KAK3654341.1 hypothetical protein LTR22_010817 [Elasticomyces elasticus]KAK4920273.1 hypothetical protein LTR49_012224 [Elasticomyces elasticus]KAK5750774.1 hypothetical protein LTS12_019140 [Elasticomyces elasticus]
MSANNVQDTWKSMSAHQREQGGFSGGGNSWRDPSSAQQPVTAGSPPPPIGALLETITYVELTTLSAEAKHDAIIKDCEFLASFDLTKGKSTFITVPDNLQSSPSLESQLTMLCLGMPPMWTSVVEKKQLQEDPSGRQYFRDQNAARFPDHPMEPAARALLVQQPTLKTSEINIFACGSTLGNLLNFVRHVDKPFRIVVEVVGETVFFVRREKKPDETMDDPRGYGHTFPEAYTSVLGEVSDSASHQRMSGYEFAGLKCVVRSEGDGFLEHLAGPEYQDAISVKLPEVEGVTMRAGGLRVPQEAVFDVKTRSIKKKDEDIMAGELPRLYMRQIPNFVMGYFEENIIIRDITGDLKDWQEKHKEDLAILGVLLHKIVEIVKAIPEGKCEIYYAGAGGLEVRSVLEDAPSALSLGLRDVWAAQDAGLAEDE